MHPSTHSAARIVLAALLLASTGACSLDLMKPEQFDASKRYRPAKEEPTPLTTEAQKKARRNLCTKLLEQQGESASWDEVVFVDGYCMSHGELPRRR